NDAGLFRIYPVKPTSDPDSNIGLEDVCDSANLAVGSFNSSINPLTVIGISQQTQEHPFYAPFPNPSVFRLMSWFYGGSAKKSLADLDSLVQDVINAPDFDPQSFSRFSATKEAKRLDTCDDSATPTQNATFLSTRGWLESSLQLSLPCEKTNFVTESKAPKFLVSGVFHRDIVDIVVMALQDREIFPTLHLTPYKEYRVLGKGKPPVRVYGEMYSADAFFEAWETIHIQPRVSGDNLERVMVALMLWSDSTCLTNFGNASLWPVYLSLGNQSKYIRTKPQSFSQHHIAYLPSVGL
ncbi:hypothetical protein BC826DRAFT_881208, partial [Russula brevipes]